MDPLNSTPPTPAPVVNPLQWQLQHGTAPDGSKVCVLNLMQGSLNVQLVINPYDAGRLAAGLDQTAKQAATGLIIPGGAAVDHGREDHR